MMFLLRSMQRRHDLITMILLLGLVTSSTAWAELRVTSDFEGGNAEVVKIEQQSLTVRIMPAIREGRGWPCWWSLQLDGVEIGQTVTLEVQAQTAPYAPGKRLANSWSQPKHAAVSTDNVHWKPSAKGTVTEDKVAVYKIPMTASSVWVAWGPPFTPRHAEAFVTDMAARVRGAHKFELARTRGDRSVWGLRLGAVDAPRQVWVNARQHAWEAGGSWVGRGLMEWLVSDAEAAQKFRDTTCLHFIPIMDVDNVAVGAGGKDAHPRDHNRDWAAVPVYPEIAAAQRMIANIEQQHGLDVYIDLHNPGHDDPIFFFGPFDYDKLTGAPQKNYSRWLELAIERMKKPLAISPKYRFATYVTNPEERSRMSSGWVREHISEHGLSVTLETAWNSPIITQDSYQLIGQQLGQTLAAYLAEQAR